MKKFLLSVVTAVWASASHGTTLQFEVGDVMNYGMPQYTEAGLTIRSVSGAPVTVFGFGPGWGFLGFNDGGSPFAWEITRTDSNRFSLISIVSRHMDRGDPVFFYGFRDFRLVASAALDDFEGLFKFKGFRNLDYAIMTMPFQVGVGDPVFDNLTYRSAATPVPLPSTALALLPALGLLTAVRSRKRNTLELKP